MWKAKYISVDAKKQELPGYTPEEAMVFHEASAKLADAEFSGLLKTSSIQNVVLMCGGSGSGKSEFALSELIYREIIIYDGTLSNVSGAEVKIRNSMRARKQLEVYFVIPTMLETAYEAFLARDRKLDVDIFVKTHCGSRGTAQHICNHFPQIPLKIIESNYNEKQKLLEFTEITFRDRLIMAQFLLQKQLSEEEIRSMIRLHHAKTQDKA